MSVRTFPPPCKKNRYLFVGRLSVLGQFWVVLSSYKVIFFCFYFYMFAMMALRILFLLPEGALVLMLSVLSVPPLLTASSWAVEAVEPVRISICSWMAVRTTLTLTMADSMEVTSVWSKAFSAMEQVTFASEIFLA